MTDDAAHSDGMLLLLHCHSSWRPDRSDHWQNVPRHVTPHIQLCHAHANCTSVPKARGVLLASGPSGPHLREAPADFLGRDVDAADGGHQVVRDRVDQLRAEENVGVQRRRGKHVYAVHQAEDHAEAAPADAHLARHVAWRPITRPAGKTRGAPKPSTDDTSLAKVKVKHQGHTIVQK
jgi:hypothetical protein